MTLRRLPDKVYEENADGTRGFQRSFNQAVLDTGYGIEFVMPK